MKTLLPLDSAAERIAVKKSTTAQFVFGQDFSVLWKIPKIGDTGYYCSSLIFANLTTIEAL